MKAGIIGLGVGERHIAGYEAHPQCRVTVLCDLNEEALRSCGKRHPGRRLTTRPEDVLDDPSLDIISVAGYDDSHAAQVIAALERGKHVFVEKPLCLSREEADSIRKAWKRSGKRFSSNLILRLSPRFQALRERIASGLFGNLYYVEGDYNYGRIWKITEGWRGRLPFYSVVYGGGVHIVDLLVFLTGRKIRSVVARGNKICTANTRFRYNDFNVALLDFEDGMIGKVSSNFGCVLPHFHQIQIYGTKRTFLQTAAGTREYDSREPNDSGHEVSEAYPGIEKGDLLYNFVEAVLNRAPLLISEEEVFDAMAVCFAIEESAREGKAVEISAIR
ncbi:MAG: gfo/Idh/MocA family oxidoreductase [Candidatus Hydrogenedentota bacterium]|nr:MAG: gfo/Idh/MocA family oxidoreductase [Candidatus Hydrogenedentota bacterium]